ncbi:MAG: hypothetical protein LBJ87_00790 [bacterium]|nr:hypothetical protein [bacterium]
MGESIRLHTPASASPTYAEPQSLRTARCWREARRRREALAAGHDLVPSDSRRCLVCGAPLHRFDGPAFCGGACLRAHRTVRTPRELGIAG